MNEKFTGFVLAGGKSSRMKRDKAFLTLAGETFLERAVKALEIVCKKQVKIVLSPAQTNFIEKLPPQLPFLFDTFENRGALGGIHAALQNCRTDFAIILACDMPLVTGDLIKRLAKIALGAKNFSAIVPRQTNGRIQPLCAVYHVENCLPALEKYLSENASNAVRDFLKLIDANVIKPDFPDGDVLFFNVNEPDDYDFIGG